MYGACVVFYEQVVLYCTSSAHCTCMPEGIDNRVIRRDWKLRGHDDN